MRKQIHPLWGHTVLLVAFVALGICLWMLPTLAMGYPLKFAELSATKTFLETGVLGSGDGRLSILLFAFLSHVVPLANVTGWTFIGTSMFGLALLPWWLAVRALFDERIAWISTIILALLPVYFFEAMHTNFYTFAFLFLFSAFACFVCIPQRYIYTRWILFGLLLGLAAGAKEVMLVLLPWMLIAQWKHAKLAIVFCLAVAVGYCAPLTPQLLAQEDSAVHILQQLSPIGRTELSPLEYYPDLYTYEFDREGHDARILAKRAEQPALLNIRHQHRLLSFGVLKGGIVPYLVSSTWLLGNNIVAYFHQEQLGGAFLWLLIVLGGVQLYRSNRRLFWWFTGLVLSMELIIRFGLQFQRSHIMNTGWGFAVLAALGVADIADRLTKQSLIRVSVLLTAVVALQLLQINRSLLAREYLRSEGPRILMEAEAFTSLPADAVVAVPRTDASGILGETNLMLFHPDTLERITEHRKVREVFEHYGITHISRYSQDLSDRVRAQYPITVVTVQEDIPPRPPVSDLMTYVLNLLH